MLSSMLLPDLTLFTTLLFSILFASAFRGVYFLTLMLVFCYRLLSYLRAVVPALLGGSAPLFEEALNSLSAQTLIGSFVGEGASVLYVQLNRSSSGLYLTTGFYFSLFIYI
jgi:hypothetical protein